MNKKIFWILFILSPSTIFAQEYLHVNTKYNKAEKNKELTVEIVNKSDNGILIFNSKIDGTFTSYFELYYFDKNGQRIPVSYYFPASGVPFMNALDTPKAGLSIKPNSSLTFKYSIESLFRYSKEQDRIRTMKLKFHIEYAAFKNDSVVKKDVYEAFSKTISF